VGRIIHKRINRSLGSSIFVCSIISVFAAFMVIPMIYAISNSLKPLNELWIFPPRLFVINPTIKNYNDLFNLISDSWIPFSRNIFNTLFISICGTLGHIILASMCAYSISKLRFYGSKTIFRIIVYSLMFSATVTTIPNFLIITRLNLIDNYLAIILPAFSAPLGLYLMKQFMESMVPDSLLEAAKIDGAREGVIFFRIVMPIIKPAWLTLVIFSFQSLWNSGSNLYIQSEELKTLNYAISQILAGGIARAGVGAAAVVVMMILPIIVFIFTQSNVVETMSTSGMKD
jgi:ABC-type glycerol-3-phosphate transport system permease component